MLTLLLAACTFEAAGGLLDSGADPTANTDTGTQTEDTEPQDTGEPPDPWEVDNDGDGLAEVDGDCDDNDSSVHPGAYDGCDGVDQDCDDEIDEDAATDDVFVTDGDWDLGNLDEALSFSVTGLLHNEDDADNFTFEVSDGWVSDEFPVEVSLGNIPSNATYRLRVSLVSSHGDETPYEVDTEFGTGSLSITIEDRTGPEDGGVYRVLVDSIANADCGLPYQLNIGSP